MALKSRKNTLNYLLEFLRPYRFPLGLTFIALIAAAISVVSLGMGLRYLIDEGFAAHDFMLLNKALLFMLILVAVMAVASFCRSYLSAWVGERVTADIKQEVFKRLLTANPSFYDATSIGTLMSRLHSDTGLIQTFIGGAASTGLRSLIQFSGALFLMFVTNLKLALLLCLVIPFTLLPIFIFGKRVKVYSQKSQDCIAELTSISKEALGAVMTVQAFGNQGLCQNQFQNALEKILKAAHQRIMTRGLLASLVILLAFSSVSLILWIGGREVLMDNMSSGELLSFVFYAALAAGSTNSMGDVIADWQRAATACEHLITLSNHTSAPAGSAQPLALPSWENIIFDSVTFCYPRHPGIKALKDISLTIRKGEKIALVGPSGSGKTTLFRLLLRFYDPDQGSICFDHVNAKDIDLKDLRGAIGWVDQEPILFSGSVSDNIRFGNIHASDTDIKAAAHAAFAAGFIENLPQKFETPVGERGLTLSCGQRQRIAIARAILKNPEILLLDEATNALDAESEYQVQMAVERLMQGRTTLVVTHRLSTALQADRIVVFEQGVLIASGAHAGLMRENPLYQRLAALQFDETFPAKVSKFKSV